MHTREGGDLSTPTDMQDFLIDLLKIEKRLVIEKLEETMIMRTDKYAGRWRTKWHGASVVPLATILNEMSSNDEILLCRGICSTNKGKSKNIRLYSNSEIRWLWLCMNWSCAICLAALVGSIYRLWTWLAPAHICTHPIQQYRGDKTLPLNLFVW